MTSGMGEAVSTCSVPIANVASTRKKIRPLIFYKQRTITSYVSERLFIYIPHIVAHALSISHFYCAADYMNQSS